MGVAALCGRQPVLDRLHDQHRLIASAVFPPQVSSSVLLPGPYVISSISTLAGVDGWRRKGTEEAPLMAERHDYR